MLRKETEEVLNAGRLEPYERLRITSERLGSCLGALLSIRDGADTLEHAKRIAAAVLNEVGDPGDKKPWPPR